MAKKKKRKFKLPPGVVLPPGVGMHLRPKIAMRLMELIREEKQLNDPQIVAQMKAERLKVSQGTVLRFREAMGVPARGKLSPATIDRTNQLIEIGKYNPRQIWKILEEESHQISVASVRNLIKAKKKSPLAKALKAGDVDAVKSLVRKMDPAQRLLSFRIAMEERMKVKLALSTAKSESNRYKLNLKFKRIDLLLKVLCLFMPARVLEEYTKKCAE